MELVITSVNAIQVLQMFFRVMDVVVSVLVTEIVNLVLVILNVSVNVVRLMNFRRQLIQRSP